MKEHPMSSNSLISDALVSFKSRLAERKLVIAVLGLGYVGLPLVMLFADRGFRTIGFDIDSEKVAKLLQGQCYLRHLDGGAFKRFIEAGLFQPTTDYALVADADALVISVPTPLTPHREPDLSYIRNTA